MNSAYQLSLRFLPVVLALCACSCATSLEGLDDPKGELDEVLRILEQREAAGRYGEKARRDLERLAVKYPRDAAILFANGVYAAERNADEQAAVYLDAALRVRARFPEAVVLRGEIALREGNVRLARRLVEEQVQLVPDHAGLRELLGAIDYLDREYDSARSQLELALKLGAPRWRVAYHLGLLAEAEGDSMAAIELYDESQQLNADFDLARSRLRALRVNE